MSSYGLVKLLHLAAVAVFVGSIITVWVGKWFADKHLERVRIPGALDMLLYIDQRVTGPSAAVLTVSGFLLLSWSPSALYELWFQLLVLIWIFGAAIAHVFLIPRLKGLRTLAMASASDEYARTTSQWNRLSAFLIVTQFVALGLSVLKPSM